MSSGELTFEGDRACESGQNLLCLFPVKLEREPDFTRLLRENHPFDRLNVFQLESDHFILNPSTSPSSDRDLLLLGVLRSSEFEMVLVFEVIGWDR